MYRDPRTFAVERRHPFRLGLRQMASKSTVVWPVHAQTGRGIQRAERRKWLLACHSFGSNRR
jgi:hypothetical protein